MIQHCRCLDAMAEAQTSAFHLIAQRMEARDAKEANAEERMLRVVKESLRSSVDSPRGPPPFDSQTNDTAPPQDTTPGKPHEPFASASTLNNSLKLLWREYSCDNCTDKCECGVNGKPAIQFISRLDNEAHWHDATKTPRRVYLIHQRVTYIPL